MAGTPHRRFNAAFLDLPPRATPPRRVGLTHVLDRGLSLARTRDAVDSAGGVIDYWKLGWGTAYLDPALDAKVALLGERAIRACSGGTLLEVAWLQGRAEACLDWLAAAGLPVVEVSNGSVGMPAAEKRRLIAAAAERFVVLAEVGTKDARVPVAAEWAAEAAADLDAGAALVVCEGRESGTVGLYEPDGSVRAGVVDAVVTAAGGPQHVLFEAPAKAQQVWFVQRFGPDVNLGNVAPDDALALEALRLGLRADTVGLHAPAAVAEPCHP